MTFHKVRRMLADILGISEDLIGPETRLNKKNGVDAVSLAKLIIKCERAFRVTIHDDDATDMKRLVELADYIDERIADGRDGYALPTDEAREAWYYE